MKKLFFSLTLLILSIGSFSFGQSGSSLSCKGEGCFRQCDGRSPTYGCPFIIKHNTDSNFLNIKYNSNDKIKFILYPLIVVGAIGLSYGIFLGIKKYKSKIGKLSDKSSDESGKL